MKTLSPITPEQAEAAGLRPISDAYKVGEEGLLAAACEDLERGGVPFRLVKVAGGLEIWRKKLAPIQRTDHNRERARSIYVRSA